MKNIGAHGLLLHKSLGAEDPLFLQNKTHMRQGISFTLFLREEGVCKIERASKKKKDLFWKIMVREIYSLYVLKQAKKECPDFWVSEAHIYLVKDFNALLSSGN